jgi:hypothetical protein
MLSGRAKLEGKDSWVVAGVDVDKNAPIAFN